MTPRSESQRVADCDKPVGLECRNCGCRHFYVVYTRPAERGITRVRACRHCGRRIVTRETILGDPQRGQYRS